MEMDIANNPAATTEAADAPVAASSSAAIGPVKDASQINKATPFNNDKHLKPTQVTGEKMTSNDPLEHAAVNNISQQKKEYSASFSVTCPDGSVVHLSTQPLDDMTSDKKKASTTSTQMILGRGTHGIPASASHVSRQACVLRMVQEGEDGLSGSNTSCVTSENNTADKNRKQYALELVVLGSQPCRITRQEVPSTEPEGEGAGNSSKVIFARSISQIITDGGTDFSPSSIKIRDGDIIEPCDRPMDCNLDEATKQGCYHPFTVRFSTSNAPAAMEEKEKNTAALFSEASKKIEAAGVLLEERKKAEKEGVEGDEEVKDGSQDTVDVNSIMAKDVKMDEQDGDGSKDDDVGKLANEKNDEKVEEIKSSGEDTLMVDVSTSESTNQAEQSNTINKADSGKDCAISTHQEGSTKVVDTNLPAKTEPTSTTEALKNTSARPNKESKSTSSTSEEESSEEEYEFDDARQEIIEILQEIDSPGTFAVGGSCDGKLIMPGLVVDGLGPIGLPLSKSQAAELAKRCEQAPFGRGEKTIIDKSVRDTFQLAPDFFQITNPAWKTDMDAITKKVCLDLGVQCNLEVEAHLYKLLLYEEGSFFAPHRDSEKEEGMFGTLVIVLPSQFTGGELVVNHKGETETFRQEEKSSFSSQYAAFYADCKHELKKVTSGYRLCIVYNLVKCSTGTLPQAPDNSSLMKRFKAAASQWADNFDGNKIVLMTDHLYTPAGIKNGSGSARYKGSDAYVVELLETARRKGIDIDYDHGTLSLSETGIGGADGGGYWGRTEYYWEETYERDLSLCLSSYGNIGVDDEEEVVPEDFFENLEPEDESFEPTGNAGIEAERQYADSEAIVIWPRSKRWMIVTNNDTSRMCSYLLKACSKGTSDSESITECLQKANAIIPRVVGSSKDDVLAFVRSILMIEDKSIAKTFLSSYLKDSERSVDAIIDHIQALANLCGPEAVTSIIVKSLGPTRFLANPKGTANFVLKYIKKEGLPQEQEEKVLAAFVDCMCPQDKNVSGPLKASIDGFPLEAILTLLLDKKPDYGTLAKRVLSGYVEVSCLEFKKYSYSYSSTKAAGPVLLVSSVCTIVKLCDLFGWTEYKDVLVDAVRKLCELGKSDVALDLVGNLAPKDNSKSERADVCSELAGVACDKALASLVNSKNPKECKSLLAVIGRYCPLKASKFVEVAEKLDFDTVLYPLVTDSTLRLNASDCVIDSLNVLAKKSLTSYLRAPERSLNSIYDRSQALLEIFGDEAITPIIVESLNTSRFVASPTGTANFVLKYLGDFGKKTVVPQEQREKMIAALVDSLCPAFKDNSRRLKEKLDGFPLGAILAFFDKNPDHGKQAKRVLEGYLWLSCLELHRHSHSSSSTRSEGPILLECFSHSIVKLCESFGWTEYKDVLLRSVQQLCNRGKSDVAISFVDSISPNDGSNSERSGICSELAGVTCDRTLTHLYKSKCPKECKNLLILIGRYCPLKASKFVDIAKNLDFDTALYPLVTDSTLRSHASDCVTSSLDRLTFHCEQVLRGRLSVDIDNVKCWALPNASIAKNSSYSSFLRNPCQQVLDWQVRKADHAGFMADLRGLIQARDVNAQSYQPRGRGAYHFRITKLKSRAVPASSVESMKCPCSSSNNYSRYSSYPSSSTQTSCLLSKHKTVVAKYKEDERKMKVIKSLLPLAPAAPVAAAAQKPQSRSLYTFNVVYNTARLGLKTNFLNNKDIVVKDVTPGAQNASLIKAGDFIVGINEKRFEDMGMAAVGKAFFEEVMTMMKGTKRPMSVIFERPLTAIGNDEDANRKRPAAIAHPIVNVGGNPSERSGANGSQQPPAKKAKAVDVIDLT